MLGIPTVGLATHKNRFIFNGIVMFFYDVTVAFIHLYGKLIKYGKRARGAGAHKDMPDVKKWIGRTLSLPLSEHKNSSPPAEMAQERI